MKRKRIIVMGFMGSCPIAGVIWQHLHYIVGLQRLGHDVYYLEDSARLPYHPATFEVNNDYEYAARLLRRLADEFDFAGKWSFCARYLPKLPTAGLSLSKIRSLYRSADAILNVCGTQEFNDDLLRSERIIYLESDPGVEQIKVDCGDSTAKDYLTRHHVLFTFGENVGTKEFPVPPHGLSWLPTRQPVVLDFWRTTRRPRPAALFTTIANWSTSGLKDISWKGERYLWSKSREFLRFIKAPQVAKETFELATDFKDEKIRTRFLSHNWQLRLPHQLSVSYQSYRQYIRQSKGEFTVAKDQYVRLRTGWFSDRSACYLAAGRPVVTQDTGFVRNYGEYGGLFGFSRLEEISEAVRVINADYRKHSRAAAALARELFDAEKVLTSVLERAGI